jgi:hypothetical protein
MCFAKDYKELMRSGCKISMFFTECSLEFIRILPLPQVITLVAF